MANKLFRLNLKRRVNLSKVNRLYPTFVLFLSKFCSSLLISKNRSTNNIATKTERTFYLIYVKE